MTEEIYQLDDTVYPFMGGCCCRSCKHFHGIEKGTCEAYPNGIPEKFSIITSGYSGKGKFPWHDNVETDQTGSFTWEFHG